MKKRLILLTGLLAMAAFGADVTGSWTAQVPGRNGAREVSMTFMQSGEMLTGTVGGGRGEPAQISDGKVSGDMISFTVAREVQGNSVKINYTGTISGDEIKFKQQREGGEGQAQEFTAKRAQK